MGKQTTTPRNQTGRRSLDIVNDDPRVATVFHDEDGYWLWLDTASGWTCDPAGAHDGHEDTVKDLLRVYRGLTRCTCADCRQLASV